LGIAFTLLKSAGFIPNPIQPAAVPVERWDAANQAVIDRQKYCTEVVGNDEHGVDYTEEMLDALPAKEALRLRRLFETGTRGNERMGMFFQMKDDAARIREKLFAEAL
jgi:hypothetical protein